MMLYLLLLLFREKNYHSQR